MVAKKPEQKMGALAKVGNYLVVTPLKAVGRRLKKPLIGFGLYFSCSVLVIALLPWIALFVYPEFDPHNPDALVRWGLTTSAAILGGMVALGGAYHFFNSMGRGKLIAKIEQDSLASAIVFSTFLAGVVAIVVSAF